MESFYFMKCEHQDNRPRGMSPFASAIARSTCTVRVFGKNEHGATVAVELFNYLPNFYVSFRDRTVCALVINGVMRRVQEFSVGLSNRSEHDKRNRLSYIKGMETATGFSSLVINKNHQDRSHVSTDAAASSSGREYGDTSLFYSFRVDVRCFNHVRPAIREILEVARSELHRRIGRDDIRFYQSSLEPEALIAETLKLRPCRWTLFDASVCEKTTFADPYESRRSADLSPRHTYAFDFERYVDRGERGAGRVVYAKTPFGGSALDDAELDDRLPPPPVKVLSFDIECLANDVNVFPTPDTCPVIQIATVTASDALGRDDGGDSGGGGQRRRLYTLRDCEPLYDEQDNSDYADGSRKCTVRCFEEERDMLAAFCADLVADDPDVLTGYYIENFDLPFLFARFEHHGLAPSFGRLGLVSSCVKNDRRDTYRKKFASHVPKSHFTTVHGRTVFDACVYARKEFTMRSYTLNAVAERFLGTRKDDVHYTQIPSLFRSGPKGRAVLGRYCVKDAQLVVDLLFDRRAFANMFERCKVFNTPLAFLLDRGQQVRIMSMLLKWCTAKAILIDDCTATTNSYYDDDDDDDAKKAKASCGGGGNKRPADTEDGFSADEEEGDREEETTGKDDAIDGKGGGGGKSKHTRYDGAVVIDPKTGLYHDPVVCLDYASLYPSIMIAYNLCYSTMITDTEHGARLVTAGDAVRTPVGHYFLKTDSKKGLLPSILETLIATRSAVRARMAGLDRSSVDYTLLDGQQGALKIAANSIYGATGCQEGKLYFLHIPSSVTAYGRELITTTKRYVESTYTDREVVYGDTDSVMVRMIGWTTDGGGGDGGSGDVGPKRHLWQCADAGDEMADSVTRLIDRPPIRLQFETVYLPFLLTSKKRYAAGVYKCLDRVRRVARTEGVEAATAVLAAAGRDVCCKGLEVVRRDNCLFVKTALQKAIDMIMDMVPADRVVEEMRDRLATLLRGEVNVRDLIVSKEWSKRTKNPTPHDRLAQKLAERDPGEAPQLGDRIQYVVVAQETHGPRKQLYDRAEDPLYALEHGLTLDYVYYANNQLVNPLANLLAVVTTSGGNEEIKDRLWPEVYEGRELIERPGKKKSAALKRPRRNIKFDKAPPGNAKITSYLRRFSANTDTPKRDDTAEISKDIEDICTRLVAECMLCKSGDVARVATCKNRDCSTLYERYAQKSKIKAAGLTEADLKKDFIEILNM